MKKLFALMLVVIILMTAIPSVYAYTDEEINMITNVVNGEIGGLTGSIKLTYADGSQEDADSTTIRQIHACVVDNQVNSDLFPSSVKRCIANYWSSSYTSTGYKSSSQWKSCRSVVETVFDDRDDIPINIYAATCDSRFAKRYSAYKLWARVDWNTGWIKGTFYYYTYGDPEYQISKKEPAEIDSKEISNAVARNYILCIELPGRFDSAMHIM